MATTYEAPLPGGDQHRPGPVCHVACHEVLPGRRQLLRAHGASRLRGGLSDGGQGKELVGYVFLSTDIVDIPAYSGKPVVTLIGMDTEGIIVGTRILRHSEPILLLGIPEEVLTKFVNQYLGKFVGDKIEIGKVASGCRATSVWTPSPVPR
jgi:NosR/NirI family transcriptional regulator, nitrous oxide reductase regulator